LEAFLISRVNIREDEIPPEYLELAKEKRRVLIETLADVDDVIADRYLMEEEPTVRELQVYSLL
jgi:elongation factor G